MLFNKLKRTKDTRGQTTKLSTGQCIYLQQDKIYIYVIPILFYFPELWRYVYVLQPLP